jgi:hypothetical protein
VSDWPEPTLADVDSDGAVTEALARLHGETRAGFLRRAVIGSGALLAACATPAAAAAGPDDHDVTILNFALALEYLQAAFYTEVDQLGHLSGPLAQQARVVGAHERAHVRAFRDVLGDRAIRRPRYDFRGATESGQRFAKTAVAFEDLSVAAYKGQAPRIHARNLLVPALAIHAVEARHAAWIRRLAGVSPVLSAFDEPISMPRTLRVVNATHFAMTTGSRRSPRFTG